MRHEVLNHIKDDFIPRWWLSIGNFFLLWEIQMNAKVDFEYLQELGEGNHAFLHHSLKLFCQRTEDLMQEYREATSNQWIPSAMEKMAHSLKSGFGLVHVEGVLEQLESMENNARFQKDAQLAKEQWDRLQETWESVLPVIQDYQHQLARVVSSGTEN